MSRETKSVTLLDALEGAPMTIKLLQETLGWREKGSDILLSRLVREMSLRGLLCHAESSGPWYHTTEYRFARTDKWLPHIDLGSISEKEALISLARSYLKSYGPASIEDFAYWAGMRIQEAKPAFDALSDSLVEVTIPEQKRRLLILEEDVPALLEAKEGPTPVKLLPQFDTLIMGHKDKTRFINPSVRNRIFLPRGDVAATLMTEGRVQGVWIFKKMKNLWRIELSPFNRLFKEHIEAIEAEVDLLRRFTGFQIESIWKEP